MHLGRWIVLFLSAIALMSLFTLGAGAFHGRLFAFQFNPYATLSLCGALANLIVLAMLVRRPSRTDERTWLTMYVAGYFIFALCEGLQRLSVYPETAVFWTMISGEMQVTCAASVFLFALAYTSRDKVRYNGTIVGALMSTLLIIYFYCATQIVFKTSLSAVHWFPWGFNNEAGPGLTIVTLWSCLMYIAGCIMLLQFRRRTANPILRKQSFIFMLAIVVPFVVGIITDGVLPSLEITFLPPMAMLFTTVTGAVLTFGVLKYKLLTINPTSFSETILSIVHEAVVVTDTKFMILYMNREAETLLGLRGTAGGQRSLMQFLRSEAHMEQLREAYQVDPGTLPKPLEHIDVYNTTKHKTPVRVTNSRLPVEDFMAYVMVLSDITAELHSKSIIERTVRIRTKELHEARAYLVASINSLGQGFILVDEAGKVEIANQAARRSLADTGANMTATTIVDMVRPMHWDVKLGPTVERVLEGGRSQQLHAAAEDGSFFDLYLTPVIEDRGVIGAAIIIEDVTERKILERSRDEFFSIASHELRTPLTAIRGNASLVKDNLAMPASHRMFDQNEMVGMIDDVHTSSIRLIEIVNDFLDSSRLEQGKMQFDLAPTPLKPVVDSVCEDFERVIAKAGNTVKLEGLDTLPMAMVDRNRVRQVLYNILSNSFKYTQKGTITIKGSADGKKLVIHIRDTGIGITPENQKLLFHKFQQAGDSLLTRDTNKGTGLGLYISRLLAQNMGGGLELEKSEPGNGTTFKLTLPVADEAAAPKEPVASGGINTDTGLAKPAQATQTAQSVQPSQDAKAAPKP
jgi:PAS domain S-box-containing protein